MSENKNEEFSVEGLREFTGVDEDTKYYIKQPTADDIRKADWEYSKTYTKSLVAGITTTSEMTDILMQRGIIGPDFEQRSNELAQILSEKIEALQAAKTIEEKQELALEVASAREELYQWNQRLNAPLANTCEQIADDARLEYLTYRLVVDANGNKLWNTYEDYLTEKEQGLAQKARYEVILFMQGLDSDFLEHIPEAEAMREVEQEALAATIKEIAEDAQDEVIKESAEADVKPEEKPKAKRRRKTTRKTPSKKN